MFGNEGFKQIMTAINMETRILPVWRGIGLASLLLLTTNCAADTEQKQPHVFSDKELHACYLAIAEDDRKHVADCLAKGLDPEKRYLIKRKNKETKKPLFVYFAEGHSLKDSSLKGEIAPMDQVVQFGRAEIMEMFLKAGANPNYRNKGDEPILIRALNDEYRVEKKERASFPPADNRGVAFALLEHGADPNAYWQLKVQHTALAYAAEYNDLEMVKRLVELGADVNAPKDSSWAPLFLAAEKGHVEIAKYLVEQGADMYGKDSQFNTTPIKRSVNKMTIDVALFFLEKGVNPNDFSTFYLPFTEELPRENRHKLVKTLIDKGMDVSQHEISSVVRDRDLITLKMLIEAGAPLCMRDYHGQSIYDVARKEGYQEIADYLASKGGASCS